MKSMEPLQPFVRRLRLEAWINAAFFAVAAGAATAFLVMLICRIFALSYPFGLLIGLSLAVAAVAAVVTYFVMFRAGVRQVLRRVDEAGLQDRVSMMYEQWGDTSYLAVRQREDTLRRLRALKPRAIRLKLPLLSAVLVFSLALTTIGVAALPPRVTRVSDPPIEDTYAIENDEVKNLIISIDKKVGEQLPAGDAIGDRINDIVQDIKDALFDKNGNVRNDLRDEEKASELDQAIGRIDELIRETLASATIGQLLKKRPETKALGEALLTRKEADVNGALDAMLASALTLDGSARAEHLSVIASGILGDIEASGVWEGNELVAALNRLVRALSASLDSDDADAMLATAFGNAKGDINNALALEKKREAVLEDVKKDLEDAIGDLMDDYKNSDKHINPDLNRGDDSENNGGDSSDLPTTDTDSPGGDHSTLPGGGTESETEFTFYDPLSKTYVRLTEENVEAYKQRLLDALESGQYTEEQANDFYSYYNKLLESLQKNG